MVHFEAHLNHQIKGEPGMILAWTTRKALSKYPYNDTAMEKLEKWSVGMLWRIIGTIIVFAGFLVGSLVYVGFYSKGGVFQDFIVVAVALIVALAAIAIMWVTFAWRRGWMPGKWSM